MFFGLPDRRYCRNFAFNGPVNLRSAGRDGDVPFGFGFAKGDVDDLVFYGAPAAAGVDRDGAGGRLAARA